MPLVSIALLALGACATIEQQPSFTMPPELFRSFAEFIQKNTSYRNVTQPRWLIAGRTELPPQFRNAQTTAASTGDVVVPASYHCASRTIYMSQVVADNFGDLNIGSILLHELVHHAQCTSGRLRERCAAETEAYSIQEIYLRLESKKWSAASQATATRLIGELQTSASRHACSK